MIHPATIEQIKDRMDILDVVGEYVSLKRSGSSYKALSPFSAEKTPSFYVVPTKGIFKDFSSGKGGDSITFLMEIDGLSYVEALKFLAQRYGIEIVEETQSDEALQAQNKRESLFIITKFANDYFQNTLHNSEEGKAIGLTYFKERGITEESIKKFELGYSKELWDGLLNEASKKKYSKELLSEAGLAVLKEDGKSYDRFRSRVMFPIHNVSGKPIAFAGRKLSSTDKSAKYINSPETELYHKSKVLYGLFQGKNAVRKEDLCYLVEGYTDVISMHQSGVENVVASSGTALTQEQIRLIRRYTKNVTVIYDGDAAGIRASFRGIDMLLEGELNVKAVSLPDGEDPDSYARQLGKLAFQEYLKEESQDIIRFKTKILLKDTDGDPVKKAEMIKDIISSVVKIPDPVKRNVYIQECSNLLEIPEEVLISEQNKILIAERKKTKNEPQSKVDIPLILPEENFTDRLDISEIIELQERESIRVLLNYGDLNIQNKEMQDVQIIAYILNELEEIQFSNPIYRKILEICKASYQKGEIIIGKNLLDIEDEEVKNIVVDLLMEKYSISENWFDKYEITVPKETDFLKDVTFSNILRLKFRIIQQLIKEEQKKIKNAINEEEINELLDEIQELKQMEMEIAKILGNVITA